MRRAKPELYGRGFRAGIDVAFALAESGLIVDAIQRAESRGPLAYLDRETPEDAEAWHTSYLDGLRDELKRRLTVDHPTWRGASLADRDNYLQRKG